MKLFLQRLMKTFQGKALSFEVLCRAMNTKYVFDEYFLECIFSVDAVDASPSY